MKNGLPVLVTILSLAFCSIEAVAGAHWIKWHAQLWLDTNSISRTGPFATFDTVQGDGDPVEMAKVPEVHLTNRFDCEKHTHNIYSPIMDVWLGEGDVWDADDQRVFELVCKPKG